MPIILICNDDNGLRRLNFGYGFCSFFADAVHLCPIRATLASRGATLTRGKMDAYHMEKEAFMGFTITVKELKDRMDKGDAPFLLDVREPHEYSLAKLPGSVLIPLGT